MEPSSDIRLRMQARKNGSPPPDRSNSSDKENHVPSGIQKTPSSASGRGRGMLMRERLEKRRQQG